MRFTTPLPLVCAVLGFASPLAILARVGETQEELERRLFQPFIGKFQPREKNPDPFKEEEALRHQPFHEFRPLFPPSIREGKYWKSSVPNVLSNENGWRMHVFYHDGRSALEAYQRVGDTLNEFEIQNILNAHQGASEWRKIEPDTLEARASAIGCHYQLADGSLRAKVINGWLLVFSVRLDAYVKEQQRMLMENQTAQKGERLKQQQATASASTAGF
jgi:hypothetical protein